jgi:hypothetical protein
MTYWEKYISEEMTAAQKKKAAEEVIDDLTGKEKKKKKDKKNKRSKSEYQEYLDKQLKFKQEKYEAQKKREIEKRKERAQKESEGKAKQALSSIKQQTISYKDQDPTAYRKALENVGSAAAGIGKAAYYALQARKKKKQAEKEGSKQPEKKEPGKPGRPKTSADVQQVSVRDVTATKKSDRKPSGGFTGTPERKKLVPSTKRLAPASKKIPPSGGTPYQAEPAPERQTGMSLGQRARRNPALKSALIKTRMENYSDWREEFLFEVEGKTNKVEKEKIIDVMNGKNKIVMNPTVTEDHKEIASGKKKDDEGYMANVELDQMERAIKALRKKLKKSDTQLPAWVQSKITRASDYVDTASEYLQSEEGLSEEKEEKRYCKLCRREEAKGECSYGPSMWEKYTISEMAPLVAALGRVALGAGARTAATTGTRAAVTSAVKDLAKEKLKARVQSSLDRAGQKVQSGVSDTVNPEDSGATAYRKALSNIVGEEVDKKKTLMLMVLKALEDKKRRKNSQLINGIIGEDYELDESVDKDKMKCNKPKAQAHGSGESGKSHIVKACEGGKEKIIRFGQLGVKGSPKKEGESEEYASRRKRFKTRHAKNIAKGKMSAAYWADKVKW